MRQGSTVSGSYYLSFWVSAFSVDCLLLSVRRPYFLTDQLSEPSILNNSFISQGIYSRFWWQEVAGWSSLGHNKTCFSY